MRQGWRHAAQARREICRAKKSKIEKGKSSPASSSRRGGKPVLYLPELVGGRSRWRAMGRSMGDLDVRLRLWSVVGHDKPALLPPNHLATAHAPVPIIIIAQARRHRASHLPTFLPTSPLAVARGNHFGCLLSFLPAHTSSIFLNPSRTTPQPHHHHHHHLAGIVRLAALTLVQHLRLLY